MSPVITQTTCEDNEKQCLRIEIEKFKTIFWKTCVTSVIEKTDRETKKRQNRQNLNIFTNFLMKMIPKAQEPLFIKQLTRFHYKS